MLNFSKISKISLDCQETWQNKVFLTMDIDWAIDPVIDFSVNLLEQHGCEATIFVTHDSPSVRSLMKNPLFEVGIHPNFNELLNGECEHTAINQIENILEVTGPVKSVRSHSLFQSSHILDYFNVLGIKYDCNLYLPSEANLNLKPWHHWNGIIRVPHFWEDDVNFLKENSISPSSLIQKKLLKVFDFHPIHVFLNTISLEHYKNSAPYFKDFHALKTMINSEKRGVRDLFVELISNARESTS